MIAFCCNPEDFMRAKQGASAQISLIKLAPEQERTDALRRILQSESNLVGFIGVMELG